MKNIFSLGLKFCSSRNTKAGFTLIELAVVLVIIGVLGAVAFSGMGRWVPNYKLKAAAQELYASMQHAKAMATKTNRNVGMEFFTSACPPEGGSYRLFVDDGRGGGTAKDDKMNGSETSFLSVTMPAGICLSVTTFTDNRGGFTARGLASTANGPGAVTLGHVKITRTYQVEQLISGAVRVD